MEEKAYIVQYVQCTRWLRGGLRKSGLSSHQGWEFTLLFFRTNHSFFLAKELNGKSLVSKRESLPLQFKKEQRSKEHQEHFTLWHKQGKSSEKLA